jgi:hypothetical protein
MKLAAASMSADGFVKNSGYFDAPAKPAPQAGSDTGVDDKIREKKAVDRQKQKDFMMDDIKRANPKGSAKDWDSRAEEKMKASGW